MGRGPDGGAGGDLPPQPRAAGRVRLARRHAACSSSRGRDPRAARRGPLPREPLLRADGRRARGRGTQARRRRDACSRRISPSRRRAASRSSRRPTAARCSTRGAARAAMPIVVADGGRRRRLPAGGAAGDEAPEGRASRGSVDARADRPTCSRTLGEQAHQRPGARRLRRRARRAGLARAREKLQHKHVDLVVYNDVVARRHRLRRRGQRGRPRHCRRASAGSTRRRRTQIAAAIVDTTRSCCVSEPG